MHFEFTIDPAWFFWLCAWVFIGHLTANLMKSYGYKNLDKKGHRYLAITMWPICAMHDVAYMRNDRNYC